MHVHIKTPTHHPKSQVQRYRFQLQVLVRVKKDRISKWELFLFVSLRHLCQTFQMVRSSIFYLFMKDLPRLCLSYKHDQRLFIPQGFIEVDTAASPEEKHVANMQINGWDLICICICICREAYD